MGHFQAEDKILDALIDYLPVTVNSDGEDEGLTVEPIKWVEGEKPEKDEKQTEWGESALYFTVTFQQDIDQDTL
jgi:hypothetical protein